MLLTTLTKRLELLRLFMLAIAKMMLGDPEGAEAIYRRLQNLEQTNPWEYHNRGA